MTELEGVITPEDVEEARERLLEDERPKHGSDEYSAGWDDALIALDLALTSPDEFSEDPYGYTD